VGTGQGRQYDPAQSAELDVRAEELPRTSSIELSKGDTMTPPFSRTESNWPRPPKLKPLEFPRRGNGRGILILAALVVIFAGWIIATSWYPKSDPLAPKITYFDTSECPRGHFACFTWDKHGCLDGNCLP